MPSLLRLLLRTALTILLVWALATYLSSYFSVAGGWKAYAIIGVILTVMETIVWPILTLITLPLRLIGGIIVTILLNALFLWLLYQIVLMLNPAVVRLEILGGIVGWLLVIVLLGLGNWLIRHVLGMLVKS